jgi:tetratricopeptide (TPR) repeat protein
VSFQWKISAGEFFELMIPAAFALSALASAWVLASTRRHRFPAYAATAWTLGTLFFPLVILPLYLIARSQARRLEKGAQENLDQDDARSVKPTKGTTDAPLRYRYSLPLLYAFVILSLGAINFYISYDTVESHLARANQAQVKGQHDRAINEFRKALALEDSAHTHNLLAAELAEAKRGEEAVTEFRIAERMGEPDDELPYNIAGALFALNRMAEAKLEYERFLKKSVCSGGLPYQKCEAARSRLQAIGERTNR